MSPSRQSFQSVDRQANPGSIPNRAAGSERFFGSSARQNSSFQAGRGTNSISRGPSYGASSRPSQSSAPAWRTFSPSTGRGMQSNSGGVYERQGTPQGRPNDPQSSQSSRDYRPNTRGGSNGFGGYGSGRPTLNMQQPIVTPRSGGSYPARAPSGSSGNGGISRRAVRRRIARRQFQRWVARRPIRRRTRPSLKKFPPRFTPLLTHRQEASKGASCPPSNFSGK